MQAMSTLSPDLLVPERVDFPGWLRLPPRMQMFLQ